MNTLRAELHETGRVGWQLRLADAGFTFRRSTRSPLGDIDDRLPFPRTM